jgi:hypothetical protein
LSDYSGPFKFSELEQKTIVLDVMEQLSIYPFRTLLDEAHHTIYRGSRLSKIHWAGMLQKIPYEERVFEMLEKLLNHTSSFERDENPERTGEYVV